ncbi:MAG: NAD(P)H-binding protein [Alphaproteobacteria bacterium]
MTRTVLVTGARGKTGREVVRQLAAEPEVEVKAGSSLPESSEFDTAARPVRFDWREAGTWRDAVADVDAIYLMRPDLQEAEDLVAGLIQLSPGSQIVLLSEQSAERDTNDSWVRRVEEAVMANATRWTNLRPSWFHQDLTDPRHFLNAIRSGRVLRMPSGGARIAWVDTRDIAKVAVKALLDPDTHHGQHYTITGRQGITMQEVAELLSSEIGTTIEAIDQPLAEALNGMSPWIAGVLDSLYRRVQNGDFGECSDTVETVGGDKPRSLQAFIRENRSEWLEPGSQAAR